MSLVLKQEDRAQVMSQACEWKARNEAGNLTAAEKIEFLNWLWASPSHVKEYLCHSQVIALVPLALKGMKEESEEIEVAGPPSPIQRSMPLAALKYR